MRLHSKHCSYLMPNTLRAEGVDQRRDDRIAIEESEGERVQPGGGREGNVPSVEQ